MEIVRQAMGERGWKASKLSQESGVANNVLSRFLKSDKEMSSGNLAEVLLALDLIKIAERIQESGDHKKISLDDSRDQHLRVLLNRVLSHPNVKKEDKDLIEYGIKGVLQKLESDVFRRELQEFREEFREVVKRLEPGAELKKVRKRNPAPSSG